VETNSFSLSILKKHSPRTKKKEKIELECRFSRSPNQSMMTPFFNYPVDSDLWYDVLSRYMNVVSLAERAEPESPTLGKFEKELKTMGEKTGEILRDILEKFDLLDREVGTHLSLSLDNFTARLPFELAVLKKDGPFFCQKSHQMVYDGAQSHLKISACAVDFPIRKTIFEGLLRKLNALL